MAYPQPGIFALGARSHYHLELDLAPSGDAAGLVRALSELSEPRKTTGGANVVVGVAPSLWAQVGPLPNGARDFAAVDGAGGYRMPSTQHSAWVWASGAGYDTVFDIARAAVVALSECAVVAEDVSGFTYKDSRDISGFEDGTENPPLDEAAQVCIVPDGAPGEGSSIVLVQRWEHDLGAFHALSLGEQEAVIGRTKADSEELDDAAQPADSHVSRMVIEDDQGEELKVFRRSVSFGDMGAHGMVFVAFTNRQAIVERMLARMSGAEDGVRDRLTYFSRPVTGSYYVVPSVEALRAFSG
jgi:putative iron-dependent peroxidase